MDFLTEFFGELSYKNKQNAPVDETIVVFPNDDSDSLWEEKVILYEINMQVCGPLLEGFSITAIEPDSSPAFQIE